MTLHFTLKIFTKRLQLDTYPKEEPNDPKAAEEVEDVRPVSIAGHEEARHERPEDITNLCAAEDQSALAGSLVRRDPAG